MSQLWRIPVSILRCWGGGHLLRRLCFQHESYVVTMLTWKQNPKAQWPEVTLLSFHESALINKNICNSSGSMFVMYLMCTIIWCLRQGNEVAAIWISVFMPNGKVILLPFLPCWLCVLWGDISSPDTPIFHLSGNVCAHSFLTALFDSLNLICINAHMEASSLGNQEKSPVKPWKYFNSVNLIFPACGSEPVACATDTAVVP